MSDYLVEEEDLQASNPQWNPSEWIGRGRVYRDLPAHVSIEVERARRLPPDIETGLPSPLHSPARFHSERYLPVWNKAYDDAEDIAAVAFHASEPAADIMALGNTPLLSRQTVQRLDREFGQAFLDGKLSIRDSRDKDNIYLWPMWFLDYARRVRTAAMAWHIWNRAVTWMRQTDEEEPEEKIWRERTYSFLASLVGWEGRIGCGLGDLTFERLAEVLGDNWLSDSVVDALAQNIKMRVKERDGVSSEVLLADTIFATCISGGAATNSAHPGNSLVQRYTHLLTSSPSPQSLSFPLHSPPVHWASCRVNLQKAHIQFADSLRKKHPKDLTDNLVEWLQTEVGLKDVRVTDDLPCGRQRDSFNCGIISTNALAHNILGDDLWDPAHARTYRYRAFCTIASMIQSYQENVDKLGSSVPLIALDAPELVPLAPAAVNEIPDAKEQPSNRIGDDDLGPLLKSLEQKIKEQDMVSPRVPEKRKRENSSDSDGDCDDDVPAKKLAKAAHPAPTGSKKKATATKEKAQNSSRTVAHSPPKLLLCTAQPDVDIPYDVQHEIMATLRNGGASSSASHDRVVNILIKWNLYRGNEKRLEKLRKACVAEGDPNPGLDINNPKQIVCSHCGKTVQLQAVYQVERFRKHLNETCKGRKKKPAHTGPGITSFFSKKLAGIPAPPVPSAKPKPTSFVKYCPGLTGAIHPRIDYYIDNCPSTGGGGKLINYYVALLFKKRKITSITDNRLSQEDRALAYNRKALDNEWRIESSPHRPSVVSTSCCIKFTVRSEQELADPKVVCSECHSVYQRHEFRTAINRNRDKSYAQLKYTPKIFNNAIQTRLMAKYKGLEEFLEERSELGIYVRFIRAVAAGQYKDNQVFLGMIQATQMANERRIRGVGMQNFRYPREFSEWGLLIRMSSPRAYRNIAQEFRMESERSIRNRTSKQPRFPLGITSENFEYLDRYCDKHGYPRGYPLCLSVDDTKLFPAMQPLYDGQVKSWFLVGLPGETQLQTATPEDLEKLMDIKHTPAAKVRLWAIQIPFPGIPPLAFAILPIGLKITASELTKYQLRVMFGLAERKFRFISNVADGAAVELNCQEQVAKAGRSIPHKIDPPSEYPNAEAINVPLYAFQENIYINTQDAPHARKTARNNIFSGARGLVLGDFVVHYKQLYDMAMTVADPTLYERDVIRADRQDDNAAHRVFSAATLQGLALNVEENMGLIIFLFVIGDLIDAYESRTMSHAERAKVALRARLFLATWKTFLLKMGYPVQRHYLPPGATKIFHTLVDGLLGLILIHRDHLSSSTVPLLPWKHESMANERIFSALRSIFPEMSLVQVLLALPNIQATMSRAKQALFSAASYKRVANGYTFSDSTDDATINFGNLATFPTDLELTAAYGQAIEENDMLWTLLNVHVGNLVDATAPERFVAPVDTSDDQENHLAEEDSVSEAVIIDLGMRDELQEALDAVQNVTGLLKSDEQEIDACAYAAAALVVDSLSKIDDLPTNEDPALLEQSRQDVARIIKLTPLSVKDLLSGLKTSFGATAPTSYTIPVPPSSSSLLDVTASDLQPLVELRESHQTEHARTGVRNYKPSQSARSETSGATRGSSVDAKKSDQLSDKQLLARRIQAVIRNAEGRKVTTGLNRKARTEDNGQSTDLTADKAGGNAANAAASAQVRAAAAIRCRRNVARTLNCTSLSTATYVFLVDRDAIVLGRVLTMYTKGGGKAGAHAFVPEVDNIGPISFILAQTYEHAGGRTFRRVHSGTAAMLGISRFAHVPAGSILLRVPDHVNTKNHFMEVSSATTAKFKQLMLEKNQLVWMTTVLNTVQRRGQGNANIVDLEIDDDVDE
ncbi:hypothetical protein GGX14DRAFT_571116 [Mycena pura]|uniref:Ubiquitin-like protease family profile domain-containing protein n=1 Tax=Mycena pura TaxID=153505 RepID=A0AAD6Y8B9_9AGAR|nr:hypothetical protein GGX14DRAFT_571116 [Mycena pura]